MKKVQERIKAAAFKLFKDNGYNKVSLRQIAEAADVNASIIIRHFGSKDNLFLECMHGKSDKKELLKGPIKGLGERIVKQLLESNNDQHSASRQIGMLLQATNSETLKTEITTLMTKNLTLPIIELLEGPDKEIRGSLVAAQISGILMQINIFEEPILSKGDQKKLIKYYGKAVQSLLDN